VSTILKALKKLEQENRENIQGLAPTHPIGASQTLGKRVKKVWLWDRGKQWTITAAILGLMVFAAYLWVVSAKKNPAPDAAPADRAMAAAKQKTAVPPQVHPVPPSPPANPPPEADVSPPAPDMTASLSQPAEAVPESRTDRPPFSAAVRRPLTAPLQPDSRLPEALPDGLEPESAMDDSEDSVEAPPPVPSEEMAEPLPTEEPQEAPDPAAESSSLPPKYANLDRLKDGRLELQAISWADDPNQRLAVINNRIVRQGQSLDEFAIVYIGADEVVVRQGPNIWKLIFMAR
jgi:hypothetical protein